MTDHTRRVLLYRRDLLVGGSALGAALFAPSAEAAEHPLASLARSELRRRSQGEPNPVYLKRLEQELTVLRRQRRWTLWQAAFEVSAAAHRAGVVLLPDEPAILGSLTAHLLRLGNVNPVEWAVPLDSFLHGNSVDYADFSVSSTAQLEFVHALGATRVEVRGPTSDMLERVFLHFERGSANVVVRLLRTPRLDVLQRAELVGFDRTAVDLAAITQLAERGHTFAPPFDRPDTAWVAEGFSTFEGAATALRLLLVDDNGWEPRAAVDDLWRVYFARGNCVPARCEAFVEETRDLLLYNEQIGRIAKAVAGFSLREARQFRCATRSQRPERMTVWRERFVRRAEVFGLASGEAHEVCDFLVQHPLLPWSRGVAVAQTAEWIWTTHALRWLTDGRTGAVS